MKIIIQQHCRCVVAMPEANNWQQCKSAIRRRLAGVDAEANA